MVSQKFSDPSVPAKRTMLADRMEFINEYPMFSQLELNMLGSCNRKCAFCPVAAPDFYEKHDRYAKIKLESYEKILRDLRLLSYRGVIVYSGLSEPLLMKDIGEYITRTKEILPEAHLEIITNGDVLNSRRLKMLFEHGLDRLKISMYDGVEQIEKFQRMCHHAGINEQKVLLRRRYMENGNYGITISNRSGLVNPEDFEALPEHSRADLPLARKCYYPFYMLKINHDGGVTMCSHDWEDRLILGNAFEENIWDIWVGKKLVDVRKRLRSADRDFTPCKTCDVDGCMMGSESYDQWCKVFLKGESIF